MNVAVDFGRIDVSNLRLQAGKVDTWVGKVLLEPAADVDLVV